MKCNVRRLAPAGLTIVMLLSFASGLNASSTERAPPAAKGSLYVGGTGAATGILKILVKAYERHHPLVKTVVYPSLGSGGGVKALVADKLTVSFSSRELKEEELQRGLIATRLFRTPLVIATHPAIEISAITSDQVANILSGEMTHWGNGALARPVLRPLKDADTQILMDMSDNLRQAMPTAHKRTGKNVAATDSDAADDLASIKGAIGVTSLILLRAENRRINILRLDGVAPTLKNLNSGKYPIGKTIYAIEKPTNSALANSFLTYLQTDEARAIIVKYGGIVGDY